MLVYLLETEEEGKMQSRSFIKLSMGLILIIWMLSLIACTKGEIAEETVDIEMTQYKNLVDKDDQVQVESEDMEDPNEPGGGTELEKVQMPEGLAEGQIINSDFESENHFWQARIGTETVELVEGGHGGAYALKASGRSENYEGLAYNISGLLEEGSTYLISAWIYNDGSESEELAMTIQSGSGDEASYIRQAGAVMEPGVWNYLEAQYTSLGMGTESDLFLYFESVNKPVDFRLDDVSMVNEEAVRVERSIEDLPSLYKAYEEYFSLGVALPADLFADTQMQELAKKHFNSITAENAMKPEGMLNNQLRGVVIPSVGDKYVDFADSLDVGLRGHTLIWHSQTPDWFFRTDYEDDGEYLGREEMLKRMEDYIEATAGKYKDTSLYAWDVVNEAVDISETDKLRRSNWYDTVGSDFIEKAFEYARKHTEGSEVKLFYNDYSVVSDKEKRMAIYELLKPLADKGLVDGVGLQAHISIYGPSLDDFRDTIELFGSIGLEVHITELDISVYRNDGESFTEVSDDLLIKQAYRYEELFNLFKDYSHIVGNVTIWGLTDDRSWLNYFPIDRTNWPLLFNMDYTAKLAFHGLLGKEELPPLPEEKPLTEPKITKAVYGTPVIDGVFEGGWNSAEHIEVNQYIQNEIGAKAKAYAMWDESHLYVFIRVSDDNLQGVNENPWEQDSVEVFIDENLGRTSTYEADDVQYRINYKNEVTINGGPDKNGILSKVVLTDFGYDVELAIPFYDGSKVKGQSIGFDIQINDDQGSGQRDSVVIWNDLTGMGWQSTLGLGTLILE